MGLFILRFWPVLIPLIVYVLWMMVVRRKAVKAGTAKPDFRDGPWFAAVLATLALGVIMFLWIGLTHESEKGEYTPAHLEGGKIVPGKVGP